MTLNNITPICDALIKLLSPIAEIVIHDLKTNTIRYINGNLSGRKVGDDSLLEIDSLDDVTEVIYSKLNFDGKLVKSTSVLLERKWLLCINVDVSMFSQMQAISNLFLQSIAPNQPKSLFTNDWQERLHITVHDYLREQHWSFEQLNNANKKSIVQHLFHQGAFSEKNAADYVAKVLNLGRATVFKYLKELRSV